MTHRTTLAAAAVALSTAILAGCQSTSIPSNVVRTNVVGEVWQLEHATTAKLPNYALAEKMMNVAQSDCKSRGLVALPVRSVEKDVVIDGKPGKSIKFEYRCSHDTGYQAPYRPLELWFSSEDEDVKKK